MASTFTNNNKLNKQGTGDNSNTWGAVLNSGVFDLIDQSLDGVVNYAVSGSSSTITIPDGTADATRSRCLRFTGSLSGAHTVTLAPNTVQKVYFLFNNTTGGHNVVFRQGGGSGSTVSIAPNNAAIVFCDGTGTNANVTTLTSMTFSGTVTANTFSGSGASLTGIPATGISTTSHVRATTVTTQTIPPDTPTIVQYGTEEYDTLGEYNNSTFRFTATSAGRYVVSAAIEMLDATYSPLRAIQLHVYVNGVLYASGSPWINTSASSVLVRPGASVNTTVNLAASGYVEIFIVQGSSIDRQLTNIAGRNYLTVDRII